MKKPLKHILILILLVGSMMVGFCLWQSMQPKPETAPSDRIQTPSTTPSQSKLQFSIDKIGAIYADAHKNTRSEFNLAKIAKQLGLEVQCNQDLIDGVLIDKFHKLNLTYRHSALDYGVEIGNDCVVFKNSQDNLATDWQKWQDVYKQLGYQTSNRSDNHLTLAGYGSICVLDKSEHSRSLATTCLDADYLEAAAEAIKPLYQIAKQSKDYHFQYFFLEKDTKIRPSKTPGYALLNVLAHDLDGLEAMAQFYQPPKQKWHFFRFSEDPTLCSEFNTDDLKNAFLGEPCLDGQGKIVEVRK